VTGNHAAQGSCPGVGIVELLDNGTTGVLVAVLRSSNAIADNVGPASPPGGATYAGTERSDIHDTVVIFKEGLGTTIPEGETDPGDDPDTEDDTEGGETGTSIGVCTRLFLMLVVAVAVSLINSKARYQHIILSMLPSLLVYVCSCYHLPNYSTKTHCSYVNPKLQ
jgi:hypothetical protein